MLKHWQGNRQLYVCVLWMKFKVKSVGHTSRVYFASCSVKWLGVRECCYSLRMGWMLVHFRVHPSIFKQFFWVESAIQELSVCPRTQHSDFSQHSNPDCSMCNALIIGCDASTFSEKTIKIATFIWKPQDFKIEHTCTCDTPLVDWLLVRPKLDIGPDTELLELLQKQQQETDQVKIWTEECAHTFLNVWLIKPITATQRSVHLKSSHFTFFPFNGSIHCTYPPRLKPLCWCVCCCCWGACGGVIPIASTGELLDEPLKVMKDINKGKWWISAQWTTNVCNSQESRKFLARLCLISFWYYLSHASMTHLIIY